MSHQHTFLGGILLWWSLLLIWFLRSYSTQEYFYDLSHDTGEEIKIFNKISAFYKDPSPLQAETIPLSIKRDTLALSLRDYASDDSITKFVSAKVSLNNVMYIPSSLVDLRSDYLVTSPWMKLRSVALEELEQLAQEFFSIFDKKIVIVSAYRSYGYQKNLAEWCSSTLCARPWRSEHQLGLTIDIFAATTSGQFLSKPNFQKYYLRLLENAHRYGRHNSYQKWVSIDTYQQEPRHRRYLWRDLATELYKKWLTFAEWYNQKTESEKKSYQYMTGSTEFSWINYSKELVSTK